MEKKKIIKVETNSNFRTKRILKRSDNRNVFFLFLFLFTSLFFTQCSSNKLKIESVISGIWVVDSVYYNSQDYRSCMGVNMIEFSETFEAPLMNDDCNMFHPNSNNSWNVIKIKDSYLLELNTFNTIFNAKHTLYFEGDERNKLLRMKLVHSNGYIICTKILFNYDSNTNLLNKLIKINR